MKHIIIVGATSLIAQHCARIWIKESVRITLVGRTDQKLQKIARDLEIRSPNSIVEVRLVEFEDEQSIKNLAYDLSITPISLVLIAHGYLPDQKECQENLLLCRNSLFINGISPVLFAEAFVKYMEKFNSGTLAIISSVAGDRGRKSNYVYGSAKSLLTCYAEGLQHRLSRSGVKVVLIKPGPTDTPMTKSFNQAMVKLASPQEVAKCIVEGIKFQKNIVYAPPKWRYIMLILKHIPSKIFFKLDI